MTFKRYLKTWKKSSQCDVGRKLDGLKNIQPPYKKYIYIIIKNVIIFKCVMWVNSFNSHKIIYGTNTLPSVLYSDFCS